LPAAGDAVFDGLAQRVGLASRSSVTYCLPLTPTSRTSSSMRTLIPITP
jgi:hypothetical protein